MSTYERVRAQPGEDDFSFGVPELETVAELRVLEAPLALVTEDKGFDPYNSTGSFDRHDAWSRTRKR